MPHMLRILITFIDILWSTVDSQTCYILPQHLPSKKGMHQTIWSEYTNSVYLFGHRWITKPITNGVYQWNLTHDFNPMFNYINAKPPTATRFFSSTNSVAVIDHIAYFLGMNDQVDALTRGSTLYAYDLMHDTWSDNASFAPVPFPLTSGCVATNDTHIFMIGGKSIEDTVHNINHHIVQIYDITLNRWNSFPTPFNSTWSNQYCYMTNNNLYIFGGVLGTDEYVDTIWKWNSDSRAFISLGTLPQAQAYGTAVFHDNIIYLVGAYPNSIGTIYTFDVETQRLMNITYTMEVTFRGVGSVIMHNRLYIFGGQIFGVGTNDTIQVCDIISDATNQKSIYTMNPTNDPSFNPTNKPSANPVANPSASPTNIPSNNPSHKPTNNPTSNPTNSIKSVSQNSTEIAMIIRSTNKPTAASSGNPVINTTYYPTSNPTDKSTQNPSMNVSEFAITIDRMNMKSTTTHMQIISATEKDDVLFVVIITVTVSTGVLFGLCIKLFTFFTARRKRRMRRSTVSPPDMYHVKSEESLNDLMQISNHIVELVGERTATEPSSTFIVESSHAKDTMSSAGEKEGEVSVLITQEKDGEDSMISILD